jgi:hypothetical protein
VIGGRGDDMGRGFDGMALVVQQECWNFFRHAGYASD